MDEKQLKEQIWAKFGSNLSKYGITDFQFQYRDDYPSHQELTKHSSWIEKLGRIGKYVVCLMHLKNVASAVTILLLVLYAPDHVKKFKTNYPQPYATLNEVKNRMFSGTIITTEEKHSSFSTTEDYPIDYIVCDYKWFESPESFPGTEPQKNLDVELLYGDTHAAILPVSGVSQDIIDSSSSTSSDSSSIA